MTPAQCPNKCAAVPVAVNQTYVLHGNTTTTWECPTCGARWDTSVAGRAGFFTTQRRCEKYQHLRDVVQGQQLHVTEQRDEEDV